MGGGTAGLQVAVALSGRLPKSAVTLVDTQEYHQLPFAHLQSFTVSKTSSAWSGSQPGGQLAFVQTAGRHGFTYVRGEAKRLSLQNRFVQLHDRRLEYDYAVLALGSRALPLSEFAFSVHTHTDALRARKAIEFAFQNYKHNTTPRVMRIAVIGGGVSGVSLATCLTPLIHSLAVTYNISRKYVELVFFEREARLLPHYAYAVSRQVEKRIQGMGVSVVCNSRVVTVGQSSVVTEDGERYATDVVLWTGDWRARTLAVEDAVVPLGARNQVLVNKKFQLPAYPNVFCVGDQASAPFPHRRGLPSEAAAEAHYVASILPQVMRNQLVSAYVPKGQVELLPFGPQTALSLTHAHARIGLLPYIKLRRAMQKHRKALS